VLNIESDYLLSHRKYYQEKGELVLDLGAYTAALEYACDTTAVIMGKPSKEYYSAAIESMNLMREDVVMIGDDINSDVGGAQKISEFL
jgi:phospholysine phosphohistidine inorganic pyrophosphate phosphatase